MVAGARQRPSIEAIRDGLLARLPDLARTLAPGPSRRDGHTLWLLNPVRADRHLGSFKIDISGPHAGRWKEFADDAGGDPIDLIAYLRGAGGDYKSRGARGAAIQWAISWLGLEGADAAALAQAEKRAERRREQARAAAAVADARKARKIAVARGDWMAAPCSAWAHDVARRYLIGARGIVPELLMRQGGGLKFEPFGARSRFATKRDDAGRIYPAIIACVVRAGKIVAAHRTYLLPDGSAKAPIGGGGRRMFGAPSGGAIRLTKGRHGCSPEKAIAAGHRDETLVIAEGIEDGLSWAMLHPDHRVWAAGSLVLIGKAAVPACTAQVIIAGQNDPPGSAAAQMLERAAVALRTRTGLPVRIARPQDPAVKDWNDLWRETEEKKTIE